MNKTQAVQEFWSSFGIPAYDKNTVPDDAVMPYITYEVSTGSMDSVLPWNASLWYRTKSWRDIELKALEIARAIGGMGYYSIKIDEGYLWLTQGTPFAQRVPDDDDTVRRIYLNVTAEFLTAY